MFDSNYNAKDTDTLKALSIRNGISDPLPGLGPLTEFNSQLLQPASIGRQQTRNHEYVEQEKQISAHILNDFTTLSNNVLNYLTSPLQCVHSFSNSLTTTSTIPFSNSLPLSLTNAYPSQSGFPPPNSSLAPTVNALPTFPTPTVDFTGPYLNLGNTPGQAGTVNQSTLFSPTSITSISSIQTRLCWQLSKFYEDRVQQRKRSIAKTVREVVAVVSEILKLVEGQEPRFVSTLIENSRTGRYFSNILTLFRIYTDLTSNMSEMSGK